jgi:hypothetical protein
LGVRRHGHDHGCDSGKNNESRCAMHELSSSTRARLCVNPLRLPWQHRLLCPTGTG